MSLAPSTLCSLMVLQFVLTEGAFAQRVLVVTQRQQEFVSSLNKRLSCDSLGKSKNSSTFCKFNSAYGSIIVLQKDRNSFLTLYKFLPQKIGTDVMLLQMTTVEGGGVFAPSAMYYLVDDLSSTAYFCYSSMRFEYFSDQCS